MMFAFLFVFLICLVCGIGTSIIAGTWLMMIPFIVICLTAMLIVWLLVEMR